LRGFLLDTNVLSELRRPSPSPAVVAFVAAQAEEALFVSEVTFAEIRFGIEQLGDPARRAALSSWLETELRPLFDRRALAITEDVILRWRLMIESGRRRGHTFAQPDGLIAATAAEAGLAVATRDTTHFVAAPVAVFNPWSGHFTPADRPERFFGDVSPGNLLAVISHGV
jgi:predicted nucleic acid-binding protein